MMTQYEKIISISVLIQMYLLGLPYLILKLITRHYEKTSEYVLAVLLCSLFIFGLYLATITVVKSWNKPRQAIPKTKKVGLQHRLLPRQTVTGAIQRVNIRCERMRREIKKLTLTIDKTKN